MLSGRVDAKLEAFIRFRVYGPAGSARMLDALVDTGFGGYLTMPLSEIRVLALRPVSREAGILADGTVQLFDVYEAQVDWDGNPRHIKVQAADAQPLLGTEMLRGHDLTVRMIDGGPVTISAIP
jgi:clan AA aspartic protease